MKFTLRDTIWFSIVLAVVLSNAAVMYRTDVELRYMREENLKTSRALLIHVYETQKRLIEIEQRVGLYNLPEEQNPVVEPEAPRDKAILR